jgi:hypothetical protein
MLRISGWAFVAVAAVAAAPAAPAAAVTRAVRCDFSEGSSRAWGEPTRTTFDALTLIYDSIDVGAGRARLVGNAGAQDVSVVPAPRRMTFIEFSGGGNVNVTTVFESASEMKAVHSRHTGTPENPTLAQLYGYCRPY